MDVHHSDQYCTVQLLYYTVACRQAFFPQFVLAFINRVGSVFKREGERPGDGTNTEKDREREKGGGLSMFVQLICEKSWEHQGCCLTAA